MDKPTPPERRRFLRESLRGSVPLLFGWIAGRASTLARLVQGSASSRKTSPPPAATDSAPAPVKEDLDKHYEEFARDNPSPPEPFSSPRSFSDKTDRGESRGSKLGNERGA